jgi:hypothetical protein
MARHYSRSWEREERARARELARTRKEREKLSVLEAARAAVDEYETRVAELKSLHKQCTENVDWLRLACSLPPPPPRSLGETVRATERRNALLAPLGLPCADLRSAAAADATELESLARRHREETEEQRDLSEMALRILAKDTQAYLQVLEESPELSELTERGGQLRFAVPSVSLVECAFVPQSSAVVPGEIKSLTATGKLTSKAMPRGQFMDLYQDFICSGVLRIAREVLAVLPVHVVLVTVHSGDDGATPEPVISVILDRDGLGRLDFGRLDPSDAVETFRCRTNFKATRKSGAFQAVTRFAPGDVGALGGDASAASLMAAARVLLDQME